jgi:hypothetical protein
MTSNDGVESFPSREQRRQLLVGTYRHSEIMESLPQPKGAISSIEGIVDVEGERLSQRVRISPRHCSIASREQEMRMR